MSQYPPPPPPYGVDPTATPPPTNEDPRAQRGTNGLAVAALVLGIIAPCGAGLLSLVFGIIALIQIRESGQKGRGLAIGGLVLTGVWILALAVFIAIAVITAATSTERDASGQLTGENPISVESLRPGDCIRSVPDEGAVLTVPGVPCSEPHDSEVFATFDLIDGDWPGDNAVVEESQSGCVDRLLDYSPSAYDDPQVEIAFLHPTPITWIRGDREVICFTLYLDGPRTGSLQGS